MRTIDDAERRVRLAHRQLLLPSARAPDVTGAARAIVALHATDPSSVHLSAWARVADLHRDDLDRALFTDRTLVKQWAMRRTLFAFPRTGLPAAVAGAGLRTAATERRRLVRDVERAGLHADGDRWLAEVGALVEGRLAEGREERTADLRASIPLLDGAIPFGEGRSWGGRQPVAPRVLMVLSAEGRIVRAHEDGGWMNARPRWTAMAAWLGAPLPTVDPADARAELVTGWLRTFGPGTERDVAWWLGDTLADVRAALRAVGAVEVGLAGGARGYVLPDDLDPPEPTEPWAALLPALDPATMGWSGRDWYLGPHRPHLFDSAGNGGTTAWWNGRVVGAWRQPEDGRVVVHLLEDVEPAGVAALRREADRLTEWLDGARPGARWNLPLPDGDRS